MKKCKKILLMSVFLILFGVTEVNADACSKDAAMQLGKIVYQESGANSLPSKEDNFFRRLNVASVALNNASRKSGSNWYQKIYNLDSNVYGNYNNYKNTPYTELVDKSKQGEILYISELVLSGKYNLPSNMYLQAEQSVVNKYGKVWTNIGDIYFGYEGDVLSSKDVFGNKLTSNTVSYFKNKAKSLMLSDYSSYTTSSVCSGKTINNDNNTNNSNQNNNTNSNTNNSNQNNNTNNNTNNSNQNNNTNNNTNNNQNNNTNSNNNNNTNNNANNNTDNKQNNNKDSDLEMIEACENPDILRIIYFIKILIDIVKIIVPIALIVIGSVDLSKSVMSNDEKEQKKSLNLFIKRLIYAVVIFLVPWIIEVFISLLGDLTDDVNWTDCIINANKEKIEELEKTN
ncbi:MAG: hypothetical protein ACI4U4_04590 [Bacilli bacterium]